MAADSEFVAYILELLKEHCPAHAKRMFGGYGIFREGLMFGLVADDTLYLKADAENRDDFVERGRAPFTYRKLNKDTSLSYYQVPEECLEDVGEMAAWADRAFAAALRAEKKKRKKIIQQP